jgi:hypothetical protein
MIWRSALLLFIPGLATASPNEYREAQAVNGGYIDERIGFIDYDEKFVLFTGINTMLDFGSERSGDLKFTGRRQSYHGLVQGGIAPLRVFMDYQASMFRGNVDPLFRIDSRFGKVETGILSSWVLGSHILGAGLGWSAQYHRRTVHTATGAHEYQQKGYLRTILPAQVQLHYAFLGKNVSLMLKAKSFGKDVPEETYVDPEGRALEFSQIRERYPYLLAQGTRVVLSRYVTLYQALKYWGTAQAADDSWSMNYIPDEDFKRVNQPDSRQKDYFELSAGAKITLTREQAIYWLNTYEDSSYATRSMASLEHDNLGHLATIWGYKFKGLAGQLGFTFPKTASYTAPATEHEHNWRTEGSKVKIRQQKFFLGASASSDF